MNRFSNLLYLLILGSLTFTACKPNPKQATVDYKRTDNNVIIRLRAEPDRLNPVLMTSNYARVIADQMYMYLLTVDPQTFELIPYLAKALPTVQEITDGPWKGGLSYTFEIHNEAVWDNGTPVTGNDYMFSLKAIMNPLVPAERLRSYLTNIKDVQVDPNNPKKFTVFTNEKYILGTESVANSFQVMPEYLYDPQGLMKNFTLVDLSDPSKTETLSKNQQIMQFAAEFDSEKFSREKGYIGGCGPYQFEEWITGQKVVLTKKANWWGDQLADEYPALAALPERMEFLPIPDDATAINAIKAEDIDVSTDIPGADFNAMKEEPFTKERYNFYTPPLLQYACLYLNNDNPKLADKRVRRALSHAINMDEIIKTVYEGLAQRVAVPISPSAPFIDSALKPITYNPEEAKRLLQEAGWKDSNGDGTVDKQINGEKVELNLSCYVASTSETGRNALLLAQGNLKAVGINMEIVPKEFTVYMQDVRQNNFEMASGGRTISPTLWEPTQDWYSEGAAGGDNHNNFQNAEADKLIEQIRVTLDEKARNDLYEKLQRIIYDEQPAVFMIYRTGTMAIHKRFDAKPTIMAPGYIPTEFKLNVQ
ncbi:MAG: ABC transporter substrate-binding protein [Saprospiraceae bacterium]|nr:ABC transporter substrate-binding protein [Saprospiraceae bacterium]